MEGGVLHEAPKAPEPPWPTLRQAVAQAFTPDPEGKTPIGERLEKAFESGSDQPLPDRKRDILAGVGDAYEQYRTQYPSLTSLETPHDLDPTGVLKYLNQVRGSAPELLPEEIHQKLLSEMGKQS